MRLLLPQISKDRVGERIRRIAPDLQVVGMTGGGDRLREGKEAETAANEIVWLNRDVARSGLTEQFFAQAQRPGTRWVQTSATGLDDPRYNKILDFGIQLTNSDAQAVAIAQYVLAEILAEWSVLPRLRAQQVGREWRRIPFREVAGTTWLIVGYGNIGREVARRAHSFGARILGVAQQPRRDEYADLVGTLDNLGSFLAEADVVLLSCTLTDRTRGLANSEFFRGMKSDAVLVNVSRGAVINEKDLLEALALKKPSLAVLDVFANEPLPDSSAFWNHPRVRLSPHNSANGDRTSDRGDELFLSNLQRFLAGQPLLNEVRGQR
jgi:phosphoglycerate dehydrogenase-like enzyme